MNNSFSTSTNIRFGSVGLDGIWWNVQNIVVPTISVDNPRMNTRPGATSHIGGDTCNYGDLSLTLIIDKEMKIYDEVYDHFLENLDVEKGSFAQNRFDLWVEWVDGKGQTKQRLWFRDARLASFGGLVVDTKDEADTNQYLEISFSILYYTKDTIKK